MGLRVNTNVPSLTALRMVNQNDQNLATSLRRLSTGLRINVASDDPSGLVISEQLRAQISSLRQASENAQNASNLLQTAEGALAEVNTLLIGIRESLIYALNTGGASDEQISAEQDAVDQALEAIDRIASTSRFATRGLLNGKSGFNIVSRDAAILDLHPISITFDQTTPITSFDLIVTQNASQSTLTMAAAAAPGSTVASGGGIILRLTGDQGTEDISLPSGTTVAQFTTSVNILRGNTGVYASGGSLFSEQFGGDSTIRLELVGGTGDYSGGGGLTATGQFVSDAGVDAVATLNGTPVRASGNSIRVVSTFFTGDIELAGLSAAATYNFTVQNSGLLFQLSNKSAPTDQAVIGLPAVYSNVLGRAAITTGGKVEFGFLSSLSSGQVNDLFNDPGNAIKIIDTAIDQITGVRAFLGAFVADNIEPSIRELSVHLENLSASESTLRDLNFAEETAALVRAQVMFQAGISVIAQTNAIPQAVLQLLQ